MDDLKLCVPPDPAPSWPDAARGTSIVLSTRPPSTFVPSEAQQNHTESGSTQQTGSVTNKEEDVRTSIITDQSEDIHTETNTPPKSTWDLQDANCILSKNSECCIDFKGFRFHAMETLFYALQLFTLGDTKYIRQLSKYTRMDYVKRCANTRFELVSPTLQDKWLCEQFTAWTQIICARILLDSALKQALLDSCGSPLCDPDDPIYSSVMMSARNMCAKRKELEMPPWIEKHTRLTCGQAGC